MVGKFKKIFFAFVIFLLASCNDHIRRYGLNEQFDFNGGKIILKDFEIYTYGELENDKLLILNYNFIGFSNAFKFNNDDFKIDETIKYSSQKYNLLINGYDIIYRDDSVKPDNYNELDTNNSFEYKITFIISTKYRESKTFKHDYYIAHFFNLYSKISKYEVEEKYPYLE